MALSALDLTIIVGFLAITLGVGLYFSRRATQSIDDYFVGGRQLPWWLAGMSIIASSMAVDTPLGITGLVAKHGVQGVWFAWSYIIGGAGTFGAFIFASLLRRSRIITAAELMELRYSGKEAAALRAFKGIYFGIIATCISMAWNLRSVIVVSQEALGWDALPALSVVIAITLVYAAASGIWGVATTDVIQYVFASVGSVALAYYSVRWAGGMEGIADGLAARYGAAAGAERLQFVPRPGDSFFQTFLLFVTLKWWGNPSGAEIQRMVAAKDERHATFATMLFAVVHFGLNYWPMILAALVSLIAFPQLPAAKAEQGYAMLMVKMLPKGLLGVMVAAQAAAFMSTIETQMNLGASFMVNDLYRRFIRREASKKHYVRAGQVGTLLMLVLAVIIALKMTSVQSAWYYLTMLVAGYGFVSVARWFWWRINAWAEIASLLGSAIGSVITNHLIDGLTFGTKFAITAAISISGWVIVSLVTPPSDPERLAEFCRKVRPYPAFWGPIRERYPDIEWSPQLPRSTAMWLIGTVCVYGICFGVGNLLLGSEPLGFGLLALAVVMLGLLLRYWRP